MSVALIVSLACLGTIGGFAAGLLGFGGGVLMFPLLYFVPPLLGLPTLGAKTVAAIVISQVFFSTLVGSWAHRRSGRVHLKISLIAGATSAAGSLVGAIGSQWVSERFLLVLFALTCLLVLVTMLFAPTPKESESVSLSDIRVPSLQLGFYALVTGTVIGFLGAGNFVLVPLLIYLLKVPTRIAIGSTLLIALMNTAAGFVGKLVTGQIPLLMAGSVVLGATVGALGGEKVHTKISPKNLRRIYAALIATIAVKVWLTILLG